MKRILIILIIIFTFGVLALFIRGQEDTWLCENGQWTKHGNPSSPMPTEPCPSESTSDSDSQGSEVTVTSPKPNEEIISPLKIEGRARGTWFFEATLPVTLIDNKGNPIAVGSVMSTEDWMTQDFINFTGELNFISKTKTPGFLTFNKANPSGLPKNDEAFWHPIILTPTETMKVKVYFNNAQLDPEVSCNKVFPVEREIPKTQAVARAALEELLKGPTAEEKSESYVTNINSNVSIQKLTIENGLAKVDFSPQLEFQVGGSCRVAAIRAQITETLKQFPTVSQVLISIDGRTEDILQP